MHPSLLSFQVQTNNVVTDFGPVIREKFLYFLSAEVDSAMDSSVVLLVIAISFASADKDFVKGQKCDCSTKNVYFKLGTFLIGKL